ncbi:MAG: hypothetical protein HY893_02860 [Deltaproteobacteria bacterium]|nr:hypothetical protein [Deltaproteobacteria bacterium]
MRLFGLIFISGFFLFCFPALVHAAAIDIPLDDAAYPDFERLEVKGLVKSGIFSTKPLSRQEAARLANEAENEHQAAGKGDYQAGSIIKRLSDRFKNDAGGAGPATCVKPLERAYFKYLYADNGAPFFPSVNNRGDFFKEGSNLRAGIWSSAKLFDTVSVFLNPEYRLDAGGSRGELVAGYARLNLGNLVLLAGRDSMWWGSGAHGTLLMTDNAKPFDMVKVTSERPFLLPWVFGRLGLFRPTLFLTRLEKDRGFPHPNLLGMRLDFKPTERLQFGVSRVFMFGGEGRRSLSLSDWGKVFIASDSAEHSGSPIDGNQIASIDASYVYVNRGRHLPFSGVKIYTEWGAEDSSGDTKTPTGRANIYGAYIDEPFRLKELDLRVEWANTARSQRYGPQWYYHGTYYPGYKYEGAFIGHHMGGDSRDLFTRVQYHATPDVTVGAEADLEWTRVHSADHGKRKWLGSDIVMRSGKGAVVKAGAGVEDLSDPLDRRGTTVSAWLGASWDF